MKPRNILISWDTGAALVVSIAIWIFTSPRISLAFGKDVYSVAISLLSIVFAVYAAALALIMTSPDDDFVRFLEEDGSFTRLVATFKHVLACLFASLSMSVGCYFVTAYKLSLKGHSDDTQCTWLLIVLAALAAYSLTATMLSMADSISYSKYRIKFLKMKQ